MTVSVSCILCQSVTTHFKQEYQVFVFVAIVPLAISSKCYHCTIPAGGIRRLRCYSDESVKKDIPGLFAKEKCTHFTEQLLLRTELKKWRLES